MVPLEILIPMNTFVTFAYKTTKSFLQNREDLGALFEKILLKKPDFEP